MLVSSRSIQDRRLKYLLNEKTETVEVVPDPDPRSLHALIMSLSEERFQTIKQLLSLTPKLEASEVRNILLEEERKQAAVTKGSKASSEQFGKQGEEDKSAGWGKRKGEYCTNCKKDGHDEDRCWLLHPELSTKPRCSACGKVGHGKDRCWKFHPELAPAWLQEQLLEQSKAENKGTGKGKGKGKGKKPKMCYSSKMVEEGQYSYKKTE